MLETQTSPTDNAPSPLLTACCQALDDKKAEKLIVLELGTASSIADYFLIATGNSEPHLRALSSAVAGAMKEQQADVLAKEASTRSGWVVVDAFDLMVHLFTEEMRSFYNLEGLWRDAKVWRWDEDEGRLIPA